MVHLRLTPWLLLMFTLSGCVDATQLGSRSAQEGSGTAAQDEDQFESDQVASAPASISGTLLTYENARLRAAFSSQGKTHTVVVRLVALFEDDREYAVRSPEPGLGIEWVYPDLVALGLASSQECKPSPDKITLTCTIELLAAHASLNVTANLSKEQSQRDVQTSVLLPVTAQVAGGRVPGLEFSLLPLSQPGVQLAATEPKSEGLSRGRLVSNDVAISPKPICAHGDDVYFVSNDRLFHWSRQHEGELRLIAVDLGASSGRTRFSLKLEGTVTQLACNSSGVFVGTVMRTPLIYVSKNGAFTEVAVLDPTGPRALRILGLDVTSGGDLRATLPDRVFTIKDPLGSARVELLVQDLDQVVDRFQEAKWDETGSLLVLRSSSQIQGFRFDPKRGLEHAFTHELGPNSKGVTIVSPQEIAYGIENQILIYRPEDGGVVAVAGNGSRLAEPDPLAQLNAPNGDALKSRIYPTHLSSSYGRIYVTERRLHFRVREVSLNRASKNYDPRIRTIAGSGHSGVQVGFSQSTSKAVDLATSAYLARINGMTFLNGSTIVLSMGSTTKPVALLRRSAQGSWNQATATFPLIQEEGWPDGTSIRTSTTSGSDELMLFAGKNLVRYQVTSDGARRRGGATLLSSDINFVPAWEKAVALDNGLVLLGHGSAVTVTRLDGGQWEHLVDLRARTLAKRADGTVFLFSSHQESKLRVREFDSLRQAAIMDFTEFDVGFEGAADWSATAAPDGSFFVSNGLKLARLTRNPERDLVTIRNSISEEPCGVHQVETTGDANDALRYSLQSLCRGTITALASWGSCRLPGDSFSLAIAQFFGTIVTNASANVVVAEIPCQFPDKT